MTTGVKSLSEHRTHSADTNIEALFNLLKEALFIADCVNADIVAIHVDAALNYLSYSSSKSMRPDFDIAHYNTN